MKKLKLFRFINQILYLMSAAILIAGAFLTTITLPANAEVKITICHATGTPFHFVPVDVSANSTISQDNGQCIFIINGHAGHIFDIIPPFTDSNGCIFSGQGNQDFLKTGCHLPIYGCTDPTALNYNPAANIDNGSCIARVPGCMDPTAINYNPSANVDDGSCIAKVPGCTDPNALNYNPNANWNDGSCIAKVLGCMNPEATNFNPAANVDDGSCTFPPGEVPGCMDPTALNYNPTATVDDGSCIAKVPGCTDPTAFNYNPAANVDDGSCVAKVLGCTDPTAINYNANANTDDGSCIAAVPGCMDVNASNYNPLANKDDGNCLYNVCVLPTDPTGAWTSVTGISYAAYQSYLLSNAGSFLITEKAPCQKPGCMNSAATNYDPYAFIDNGSCSFDVCVIPGYTVSSELTLVEVNDLIAAHPDSYTTLTPESCVAPAGCTDPAASNYNPAAVVSDGSCTYGPPPVILGLLIGDPGCNPNGTVYWSVVNPNTSTNLSVNYWTYDNGVKRSGFTAAPGSTVFFNTGAQGTHTVLVNYGDNQELTLNDTTTCAAPVPIIPVTGQVQELKIPVTGGPDGSTLIIPVTGADDYRQVGQGMFYSGLSLLGLSFLVQAIRSKLRQL